MRTFVLIALMAFVPICRLSAQHSGNLDISSSGDISGMVNPYRFDEFKIGKVHLADGRSTFANLNYNLLLEEFQFINSTKDTLSLADPSTVRSIKIDDRTFVYDDGFLEVVSAFATVKLALKQKLKVENQEKTGGYGQTTPTTSIGEVNLIQRQGQVFQIEGNGGVTLSKEEAYFLIDEKGKTRPFTKRNLLKTFPNYKENIKKHLAQNKPNFQSKEDLIKLLTFSAQL